MKLTINFAPLGGQLVCPDTGYSLQTLFNIQMNGWFDEETPLTFKFGYYLSEADMQKDFNEGTQKRMQQLTSW